MKNNGDIDNIIKNVTAIYNHLNFLNFDLEKMPKNNKIELKPYGCLEILGRCLLEDMALVGFNVLATNHEMFYLDIDIQHFIEELGIRKETMQRLVSTLVRKQKGTENEGTTPNTIMLNMKIQFIRSILEQYYS